jgi:glucosamine--fructose-6-phosphate aminotransferase (isomerizing)
MEGLRRLEYRGYDSAGVALIDHAGTLRRVRAMGKVHLLQARLDETPLSGRLGIAHTRWATHGEPSEINAHPHTSRRVAIVHNGIIENHGALRGRLIEAGYEFESATDSEVAAHLVDHYLSQTDDLFEAVRRAVAELTGAYALAVISAEDPTRLIVARQGSPLVIGVGIGEHFIASDVFALLPVTQRFMYLEEGDVAEIRRDGVKVVDRVGEAVERAVFRSEQGAAAAEKGNYRHFMLKEIFEQPRAVAQTLEGRVADGRVLENGFGPRARELFEQTQTVHIVACGTSAHAGLVARYWIESMGLPCVVELASEYRYRDVVVPNGTLFVTISQSGETADTLAALRKAKEGGRYLAALAICNVPESSLVRESDLTLLTRAGPEIGVASTKAFTTQLVALQLLALAIGRGHGLGEEREQRWVEALEGLPGKLEQVLELNSVVERAAEHFAERHHALFLGRGQEYPVAMEGALKLKEISYIHAEAYAAGELKHGPLALVDVDMPVVCVLPNNAILDKVLSNLEEVRARGGELFLFADQDTDTGFDDRTHKLPIVPVAESVAPMVYTVPLQLLSYHVAVMKGTDVDQPRNLAKSVTVE